jgi:SRSO17 transposase
MLRRAREIGALAARWVVTDAGFGEVPSFRDALDADGWWYVAELPSTTRVFTDGPHVESVVLRAGASPRPVEILPPAVSVATLAAELPASAWQTLTVGQGALGPRTYQFAAQRVWECRDDALGRETWLLLRRDLEAGADGTRPVKYAFSNAPAETPLTTLAGVSALRWTVETEFQHHKNEVGLDEYEVRRWRGWHHHMVLCLLASAFLLTLEQDWGEKGARHHPAATHSGAPRTPAPSALDPRRPAPLAARHLPAQRARATASHAKRRLRAPPDPSL